MSTVPRVLMTKLHFYGYKIANTEEFSAEEKFNATICSCLPHRRRLAYYQEKNILRMTNVFVQKFFFPFWRKKFKKNRELWKFVINKVKIKNNWILLLFKLQLNIIIHYYLILHFILS
jgi:hypothetical protein